MATMASFAKVSNPERVEVSLDWVMVAQLLRAVPTEALLAEVDRRSAAAHTSVAERARARLEIGARSVRWRGKTHHLSPREVQLVSLLAASYPHPMGYPEVAAHLWTDVKYPIENARVYAYYLRRKVPGLLGAPLHGNRYESGGLVLNLDDAALDRVAS